MPKLDDLVPNMRTSCQCSLQVEHAPNCYIFLFFFPSDAGPLTHFVGFIQILWGISPSLLLIWMCLVIGAHKWRLSREDAHKPLDLALPYAQANPHVLVVLGLKLPEQVDPLALCNDGSPAAFYMQAGHVWQCNMHVCERGEYPQT